MTRFAVASDPEMRGSHWQVDRRVPIALIFTLALQGAGFIWYGAKLDLRVASLEREMLTFKQTLKTERADHDAQHNRLWDRQLAMQQDQSVLQTDLARMQARIESIDKNLERLIGLILNRRERVAVDPSERN